MESLRNRRDFRAWIGLWALAVAVGAALRWYQLGIQVILDDEWHAIHKLLRSDVAGIVTHFGLADHSIPLTLYYRFLYDHGGLSEWGMHVPMLFASVALLAAGSTLLRGWISMPTRAVWTALMAISPLLVYLSKTARPYALTSLLTIIAIVSFRRWWLRERATRAWAVAYAGTTFLAGYLHPITLPFTLLPFVYYAIPALRGAASLQQPRADLPGLSRLARLGVATALPLLAALLPPLITDWAGFAAKAGTDSVTLDAAYRTLLTLFGITQPALCAALALCAAFGVGRLWQRDRDLVGYLAMVMLGGAAAVAAAKPMWVQHQAVLARYSLPALPFLLLFVAEGSVGVLERLRKLWLQLALALAGVAALLLAGPLSSYFYFPNQFFGHARFQFDYDPAHNPYVELVPRDPIPAFYRELAKERPATLTLIEAPWRLESNFNPHPWYQEVHRQYVKIGLVTPVCGVRDFGEYPETAAGLRLRQFAHLSAILRGKTYGADFLVMHLHPWTTPPGGKIEWPDVAACLPAIERQLGPPVFRDDQIVVFRLGR